MPPSGAEQAAAWLAPGAARLDVRVAGALSGAGRGAAVLSVNGGPPQAYAIGDALTGTARLTDIEAQALIVEQSGERIRLPMPTAGQRQRRTDGGAPIKPFSRQNACFLWQ